MSSLYTGVATYPTSITIPSDGDSKSAASVNVALEGLKNGLEYFKAIQDGTIASGILLNAILKGGINYVDNGIGLARRHQFTDVDVRFDVATAFDIDGPAASAPTITISRNVSLPQGTWTFGGAASQTVSFACPTDFSQPMSPIGSGRLRLRRQNTATGNFDRTIDASVTDVYMVQAGEIAPGNKGLVQNGTADGSNTCFDVIRICSYDTAEPFPLYRADAVTAITDADANPIIIIGDPSGPGEYQSVLLQWTGAFWEMIGQ